MLDHVFTDAIGALRDAMENAYLERQAFEERFQVDVLLGDVTWETSYGLPGEGQPPRVRADITLDWPTWAQTSYRNWYIGEPFAEPPEILVEVTLRLQRLAERPDPAPFLAVLPAASPVIGNEQLERSTPTVEQLYGPDLESGRVRHRGVLRRASCRSTSRSWPDGSMLDEQFKSIGGWVASTLVRVGDLRFEFLPPEVDDGD